MADDREKLDGKDDSRIDLNDYTEVSDAAEQFGVTADKVRQAIKAVGDRRDMVRDYLKHVSVGFIWVR